jgi:DNA-binding response OmpR family regulator
MHVAATGSEATADERATPATADHDGRALTLALRITGGDERTIEAFWRLASTVRAVEVLHCAIAPRSSAVTIQLELFEGGERPNVAGESSLDFHEDALVVVERGSQIRLRRTEFALLRYLVERRGRWISSAQLRHAVLGYAQPGDGAAVRNHIHALRRKLRPNCIESRRTLGYRFVE